MPEIPPIAYMPFFVGIVAVVMGVASKMLSSWSAHQQEMARIRQASNVGSSQMDGSMIEQLRQEIMQLRDTTTQYDMSVEKTLQDIKQRLSYLESERSVQNRQAIPAEVTQPELQQVGISGQG